MKGDMLEIGPWLTIGMILMLFGFFFMWLVVTNQIGIANEAKKIIPGITSLGFIPVGKKKGLQLMLLYAVIVILIVMLVSLSVLGIFGPEIQKSFTEMFSTVKEKSFG